MSGFVASELSTFSVLRGRLFLRTGGERRMIAFLASDSFSGVIQSHSPAALAEHGGKWLWVTPVTSHIILTPDSYNRLVFCNNG
jgi:hypothetical protein